MAIDTTPADFRTVADLIDHFGGISAVRIRFRPVPGTATERDVIAVYEHEKRLCELVDGVLVEKAMGFYESLLAVEIINLLSVFVRSHDLGLIAGADGMMRLAPGLIRIPDVSYVSWGRFPEGFDVKQPIPDLAPDLAIEVLSRSNTTREMDRKCTEYFDAGVNSVWYVDPEKRNVTVFDSPSSATVIDESATLSGGRVLPGFSIPVAEIFRRTDEAFSR